MSEDFKWVVDLQKAEGERREAQKGNPRFTTGQLWRFSPSQARIEDAPVDSNLARDFENRTREDTRSKWGLGQVRF